MISLSRLNVCVFFGMLPLLDICAARTTYDKPGCIYSHRGQCMYTVSENSCLGRTNRTVTSLCGFTLWQTIFCIHDFSCWSLGRFPIWSPTSIGLSCFNLNPLIPIVHFWLHHTAHCAGKIGSPELPQISIVGPIWCCMKSGNLQSRIG